MEKNNLESSMCKLLMCVIYIFSWFFAQTTAWLLAICIMVPTKHVFTIDHITINSFSKTTSELKGPQTSNKKINQEKSVVNMQSTTLSFSSHVSPLQRVCSSDIFSPIPGWTFFSEFRASLLLLMTSVDGCSSQTSSDWESLCCSIAAVEEFQTLQYRKFDFWRYACIF